MDDSKRMIQIPAKLYVRLRDGLIQWNDIKGKLSTPGTFAVFVANHVVEYEHELIEHERESDEEWETY
jgi:hypothetical protein